MSTYLLGAVPLLPVPLLVHKELIVLVGHNSRGESPRAVKATSVSVAASEGMGTTQSNNLLVVEAHASEDVSQVPVALGGIGETSIRGASREVLVLAARSVRDSWALHLLDSDDTGEDPKVRGGDPGELGW